MFSITSGESCPRVKFRGLGKAAGYRSPGSSPEIEHRVVKIAHHFELPSALFPPLHMLGKEGGARSSQWIPKPQWECNTRISYPAKAWSIRTAIQICISSGKQMACVDTRPLYQTAHGEIRNIISLNNIVQDYKNCDQTCTLLITVTAAWNKQRLSCERW